MRAWRSGQPPSHTDGCQRAGPAGECPVTRVHRFRAAAAPSRRIWSSSTSVALPPSTTTRPSTMTVATSRPCPVWTSVPTGLNAGVRWARRKSNSTTSAFLPTVRLPRSCSRPSDFAAPSVAMWKTSGAPPEIVDRPLLQPPRCERPAHGLDHVAMHVVGGERDVCAGAAQLRGDRKIAAGEIDLGRMRDRDAAAARACDIVLGHDDAVRGDQSLVQQADIVEQFGRRHAVPLLHLFDLHVALRQVRHHAHAEAAALAVHVAQEVARAGVDRVRRQHDAGAAVERAVEAIVQVAGVAQAMPRRSPASYSHTLFVDSREVDIVDPGRRRDAQAELGDRRQRRVRVDVHVVDDGRAEQHRFERGQPRRARPLRPRVTS